MRTTLCIYVLGWMLISFSVAMLPAIVVGWWFASGGILSIVLAVAITMGMGGLLLFAKPKTEFDDIVPREGFLIVVGSWVLCSLFGSLPFAIEQTFLSTDQGSTWLIHLFSLIDSIFESTSGLTTTGASVLSDYNQPHAIMFWRSTLHWLGGMGIIVLSLAILPLIGAGGMQLFKAEVPGPTKDRLKPRIADTAITLSKVYILLTGLQTAALCFCGMNLYESLCHTFGTVATGGFSTHPESVGGYNSPAINLVITVFMIFAGCNFALHYRFLKGERKIYFRSGEYITYLTIILLSTALLMALVYFDKNFETLEDSFVHSIFQAVSIMTTTGYATANFEEWPPMAGILLFFLMFIGGCAGSTGGGMKVIRMVLLTKLAHRELLRLIYPTAVIVVKQDSKAVSDKVLWAIAGFLVLVLFLVCLSALLLSAFGLDPVTSLSATVACLFNIGPGFGQVGPHENYSGLPALIKLWLAFLMIVGRLEVYSVLILLAPSFWRK